VGGHTEDDPADYRGLNAVKVVILLAAMLGPSRRGPPDISEFSTII